MLNFVSSAKWLSMESHSPLCSDEDDLFAFNQTLSKRFLRPNFCVFCFSLRPGTRQNVGKKVTPSVKFRGFQTGHFFLVPGFSLKTVQGEKFSDR